ncbi:uncharacterized protein [Agelaius tricolor]|uniref:uncharacterized protein isoform X1 n=1 Tax=Agelaius tricolor TaxID=9191 RepID=UPI0039F22512
MGFVDGHQTSGAPKLSCNSLSLVLTFFSDSDGLNVCQRAPFRVRGFPRAGSKCGYQQSRQSTRSAIRVAFGSCPGVVASPVATASVSERARSVRPEQLSVLRSTYSCLRDNGPVPAGASQLRRCRRIKSRAEPPIPGEGIPPGRKSRLRAAVKAEWARWSDCHLSWPSMPIPGVCSLRCCRCPRHAKEQRRAGIFWAPSGVKSRFEVSRGRGAEEPWGLLRSLVAKGWKGQHRGAHGARFNIHVRPRMDFVLSSSKSPRGYRFPQNLSTDVKERSQKMCGSTFFSVSSKGRSECGEHRVSSLLLAVTPGLPGMTQ